MKKAAVVSAGRPRAIRKQHHRRVSPRPIHAPGRLRLAESSSRLRTGLAAVRDHADRAGPLSHSQVHGAGELLLGRRDFEAIPGLLNRPGEPPIACLDDPRFATVLREIADRHDARLADLGGSAVRVTDKMPDNYMYLGLLAILFPNAVFIHCRRNLRDVAVSCWMTNFRSIRWANDPEHIGRRFTQYLRLMDHWRGVLPGRICEVGYEEAIDDLESVARRIVAACSLDWEPSCLVFYNNRRPVRTASLTQVRRPVYRKSLARWRNYEQSLSQLFAALPPEPAESWVGGPGRQ